MRSESYDVSIHRIDYLLKHLLFWALVCTLLLQRFYYLYAFSIHYIDNDQALMWLAATDYAKLIFHEPFFYGQSYNFMLEPLFAAPLIVLGVPHYVALPAVTHFLVFVSLILLPLIAYFRKKYIVAIVILILSATFTTQLQLILSLPRGFITGPAIAILVSSVLATRLKWRYFLFSFGSMIATIILQSAVLVWAPILAYLVIDIYSGRKTEVIRLFNSQVKQIFFGFTAGLFLYFLAKFFYVLYPEYGQWYGVNANELSISRFLEHIKIFDLYFDPFVPSFLPYPRVITKIVILFILFLIFHSWKRKKNRLLGSLVTGIGIIIIILSHNKTSAGYKTIFYPYARFFLALPFQLMLLVAVLEIEFSNLISQYNNKIKNNIIYKYTLFAVPFLILIYVALSTLIFSSGEISKEVQAPWGLVMVEPQQEVENKCHLLEIQTREEHPDLIIVDDPFLAYACQAIFPTTIKTVFLKRNDPQRYDRRTWVLEDMNRELINKVLIIESSDHSEQATFKNINIDVNKFTNNLGENYYVKLKQGTRVFAKGLLENDLGFIINMRVFHNLKLFDKDQSNNM